LTDVPGWLSESVTQPDRVQLTVSADIERRLAALRDLIPEAFTDGSPDLAKIGEVLGVTSLPGERYGLSWAGKADSQTALQAGTTGTLRPDRDRSIDYDDARNLVIEGDNLEVLRLLQRGYNDKIKMIYIDPPYNTGNDFIYNDDFRHGLDAYLRFTDQVSENGARLSSNSDTSGRYHSAWLSMMYPRLALARNLLTQDGVIFVSIDDHEVHNLRLLMDEVFGPENFVATVIWQKVYSPKNSARHFSEDHDYVLVYARNGDVWTPGLLPRTLAQDAAYKNLDNDPRGPWKASDLSARNFYSKGTYSITCPGGRKVAGPPKGNYWRFSEDNFWDLHADNRIWWGSDKNGIPAIKRFMSEVKQGRVPQTFWPYTEVGHNQDAKKELLKRVEFESSDSVFDTPKPTKLIRRMLTLATNPSDNDIVLDFFAGSGSTGDAVLQANAEGGGNRRFILVQTPEPTGFGDHKTVADITRARIQSATAATRNLTTAAGCPEGSFGYRSLALGRSNFKVWDSADAPSDAVGLAEYLDVFSDSLAKDATDDGIVVEVLLKEGITLDVPLQRCDIEGAAVVVAGNNDLAICLAHEVSDDLVTGLIDLGVARVVLLESAVADDDAAKSNAFFRLRDASITMRTV
jgi:adenine-specific DNA-methyltransferase